MDLTTIATIIGWTGSILLILSMVAQIRSYYLSKDVSTMSTAFVGFQLGVNVMFVIYNTAVMSVPLIFGNTSMIFLLLVMLGQKYYYRPRPVPDIEMQESSSQVNQFIYSE
jgi:uncharacterized protein with PQ loop repeat